MVQKVIHLLFGGWNFNKNVIDLDSCHEKGACKQILLARSSIKKC